MNKLFHSRASLLHPIAPGAPRFRFAPALGFSDPPRVVVSFPLLDWSPRFPDPNIKKKQIDSPVAIPI